VEADPREEAVRDALARILAAVPRDPAIAIEDKGLSATIHYRNAADPAVARGRVVEAIDRAADPMITLRHGRMSVELRALHLGDKGLAVRTIVERYGLSGLVAIGDDVTDLDMFRAARDLRAEGRLRSTVVAVGAGDEVPREVTAAADIVVADTRAVVSLLEALVG
jgi:trehalose 6-phosphate phosphatase